MINTSLDANHWRGFLEREGRVQIPGFLLPEAAERIHACLVEEVPWTLALQTAQGPTTVPAARYAAMGAEQADRAARDAAAVARDAGFGFAFDTYMMVPAYGEGRDPGLLLHRVLEELNAPQHIEFYRALSGDRGVRCANAQATRYRPGHFLRKHSDRDPRAGRLYAFVINLSKGWQADWGGLLQFVGDDGGVNATFLPRWNSLSLFKVPTDHLVTPVAPWATEDRFAITGWWLL